MGKRKERRLAALSNAGRRVKLDLFAEPSGDLGASSVHEEDGGDRDPTGRAGLPNSPSSSGEQPQNPLLLLGQYSDDELDEESNEMPNHSVTENSPANLKDKEPCSEEKDTDANTVGEGGDQKVELQVGKRVSSPVDAFQSLDNFDSKGVDAAAFADLCKSVEHVSVPEAFHAQLPGDISMGWRMVMHEESSQYYYWNVETGETSWELPDVLVEATQSTSHQKAVVTENTETASTVADELSSNLGDLDNHPAAFTTDSSVGANLLPQSEDTHGYVPQKDGLAEGCGRESLRDRNWVTDANQSELMTNTTTVNALDDGNHVADPHNSVADDKNNRAIALSTSLMKQCESLLERLKSLKGYENQMQDGRLLKYVLEVEIRLSDIKSLSTYGSPLLPFWTHSEKQLKQLEDAINNEIYQLAVSAQLDGIVEANGDSCFKDKEKPWQTVRLESEAHGYESSRKFESSSASMNVENGSPDEAAQQSFVYTNHISYVQSPNRHLADGAAVNEEVNGAAHLKLEFPDREDVDMDVDMEIEDGGTTVTMGDVLSTEEPNPSSECQSLASANALTIPPPPEEEWIPPPPPDNDVVPPPPPDSEQLPPPPPDELSYSSLPPHADIGQPPPYTEQYNSLYPDSEFQYYGHPVNLPSSNLYGHATGSQVVMPDASIYYEATVANTYGETAAVIVGPAESSAYYNLQDGLVPPVPVGSGLESSHLLTESGSVIYETLSSDRVITVDDSLESRPTVKHDVAVVSGGTDLASAVVPSALISTQASVINVKEDVSVPPTDSVTAIEAAPAPSTTAKGQPKVVRVKKRTVAVAPSLRSNKKVNSLVDKWKAVKEELNENADDEPENFYEILEKKRQREIEEWHVKQIASGEAWDNANFQPLGSDWRDRVKRRRAQAVKEAAETPAEVAPTDESQQPDLVEVSKGLPSGWQAYWDEGSKQVYYGNAITSETTWTRPAK